MKNGQRHLPHHNELCSIKLQSAIAVSSVFRIKCVLIVSHGSHSLGSTV